MLEQLTTIHPDAAESQPWRAAYLYPATIQTEVALRMVRRVVHQHQMGQSIQGFRQIDKGVVGPDIPVHHHKRVAIEQRQRLKDTTAGLKPAFRFR